MASIKKVLSQRTHHFAFSLTSFTFVEAAVILRSMSWLLEHFDFPGYLGKQHQPGAATAEQLTAIRCEQVYLAIADSTGGVQMTPQQTRIVFIAIEAWLWTELNLRTKLLCLTLGITVRHTPVSPAHNAFALPWVEVGNMEAGYDHDALFMQ